MKRYSVLITVILGLALAFVTECGKARDKIAERTAEKMAEAATGGKAKIDLVDVDISALPSNLRYPGAKAVAKISAAEDNGRKGTTYVFETSDAPAAVVAHYRQALGGWKETMAMETGNGSMVTFQTADEKQQAALVIGRNDKATKTSFNLTFYSKD